MTVLTTGVSPVNVTDPGPGSNPNDPNNVPKVVPDTLYFGTIQPSEKDFYTIDPAALPRRFHRQRADVADR